MPADIIYNAGDLIGKTLFAKVRIALYREASDTAKPFGFVEVGQPVGIIYAWLQPKASRSALWWQFKENLQFYYVPHRVNAFDISALKQQGVYTAVQKQEQAANENASFTERIETNIKKAFPWILAAVVAVPVLKEVIRNKKSGLRNRYY